MPRRVPVSRIAIEAAAAVRRARAGEPTVITSRGRAVAFIVPALQSPGGDPLPIRWPTEDHRQMGAGEPEEIEGGIDDLLEEDRWGAGEAEPPAPRAKARGMYGVPPYRSRFLRRIYLEGVAKTVAEALTRAFSRGFAEDPSEDRGEGTSEDLAERREAHRRDLLSRIDENLPRRFPGVDWTPERAPLEGASLFTVRDALIAILIGDLSIPDEDEDPDGDVDVDAGAGLEDPDDSPPRCPDPVLEEPRTRARLRAVLAAAGLAPAEPRGGG
jgi:antitoxin (DNA-binding transcriptional repressor) of toxin-antitoxin stability system